VESVYYLTEGEQSKSQLFIRVLKTELKCCLGNQVLVFYSAGEERKTLLVSSLEAHRSAE